MPKIIEPMIAQIVGRMRLSNWFSGDRFPLLRAAMFAILSASFPVNPATQTAAMSKGIKHSPMFKNGQDHGWVIKAGATV